MLRIAPAARRDEPADPRRARVGGALMVLVALSGCSASIKTSTHEGEPPPLPGAQPPEVASTEEEVPDVAEPSGGLAALRTHLQSRSTIVLMLDPDVASAAASRYVLLDGVTNATLAAGLLPEEMATIHVYPLDPAIGPMVGYGPDTLSLVDDAGSRNVLATATVRRVDYSFLSLPGGAFGSATQRSGGFEAHVGGASQREVSNGETTLIIGRVAAPSR